MKIYLFLSIISAFGIYESIGARNGIAVFNKTQSGIQGVITLHWNPGFGTYLVGQLRNITCYNSTSASREPQMVSPTNSCMLGLTINNWRSTAKAHYKKSNTTSEWQKITENIPKIKFPNIRGLLRSTAKPTVSQLQTTATDSKLENKQIKRDCRNVGNVYNPRTELLGPGPLGFLSPLGVLGNLMVTNGTGTLLLGPLELLTAGKSSVIGLPLVVWMDSIKPEIENKRIILNTGHRDRILDCSILTALN